LLLKQHLTSPFLPISNEKEQIMKTTHNNNNILVYVICGQRVILENPMLGLKNMAGVLKPLFIALLW